MRRCCFGCVSVMAWSLTAGTALAQSGALPSLLKTLQAVDREGKGNRAASQAWTDLINQSDSSHLPTILAAMDDSGPLASNWLRAAVDTIAERETQAKGKLATSDLEAFLREKQHHPRARRLAYEWITRSDPTAPDRLIPTMLNDPSLELRRDAVARELAAADKSLGEKQTDQAVATYRVAMDSARDLDQVKAAAEALKKLDHPVNLTYHFGFLQDWRLLGPLANPQGKGFDIVYPLEKELDFENLPQPDGEQKWITAHSDDEYGFVDLNKVVGKHKGALVYAVAEFQSERPQPVELRLGSENANKIWLNGELISSANVYHANGTMDQYVGRGKMKAGRNTIVLKICQNEQTEEWAQDWKFQLRVCDSTGKAIHSTDRVAPRTAQLQNAKNAAQE